jgi:altronate dehydratase
MRPDGRVATRNYVGIVTTVNCSGTVARMIAQQFDGGRLGAFPGVDGVVPLAHTSGCAMSKTSDGFRVLRQTLAGYTRHPNFAGVLVLGLGCEQNQTASLLEDFGFAGDPRVRALVIQDQGGTRRAVDAGCKLVAELLEEASAAKRVPVSASHLMLALECGGSDGHSGISANPALGVAADLLVAAGGTVVLSETPEIIGAEHLLLQRAVTPAVARRLEERVAWWLDYTRQHGVSVGDNPSEGNLRGGITTICEKSLGAVAKSGSSPLRGVSEKGFVFMDSPGYDPVAVTGQVASGCNIICFTTGRGSVFGCRPVPSIKLSTNTSLAERMEDDIDLDCGGIVEGRESVTDAGRRIFEFILATASGRQTCSEVLGFGVDEFVPWQLGPTL